LVPDEKSAVMNGMLASAWRYRRFIGSSIRAEFRARFARSRLGALWMIAQPLAQVAIFSFVLSGVLAARMPDVTGPHAYAVYLMGGTLCWSLFSDVVTRCLTIFIDNGNLIKKISFPRVSLPLIVAGVALINNTALLVAIVVVTAILGYPPNEGFLWLLPLTALTLALATGLGIVLGVMNTFSRDTGQAIPVVLQVVYWMTPIVYMPSILPESYRHWPDYNPLTGLVAAYQNILLSGRTPDWSALVPVAVLGATMLLGALALFRRASAEMPDVL
jgi:lipopolysaccharide transport system permease protein